MMKLGIGAPTWVLVLKITEVLIEVESHVFLLSLQRNHKGWRLDLDGWSQLLLGIQIPVLKAKFWRLLREYNLQEVWCLICEQHETFEDAGLDRLIITIIFFIIALCSKLNDVSPECWTLFLGLKTWLMRSLCPQIWDILHTRTLIWQSGSNRPHVRLPSLHRTSFVFTRWQIPYSGAVCVGGPCFGRGGVGLHDYGCLLYFHSILPVSCSFVSPFGLNPNTLIWASASVILFVVFHSKPTCNT